MKLLLIILFFVGQFALAESNKNLESPRVSSASGLFLMVSVLMVLKQNRN